MFIRASLADDPNGVEYQEQLPCSNDIDCPRKAGLQTDCVSFGIYLSEYPGSTSRRDKVLIRALDFIFCVLYDQSSRTRICLI